jgi:transposase InsO family protein
MSRETSAGVATVTQLCEAFGLSRAAYYAARRPRPAAKVVALRPAPRHTSSEVALAAIREVIAAEPAWGVRKVWATLKRDGLKVSRKRVHALMRANGLVLARDREPGETTRGHVVVPEPNRRFGGDLTTVWTKKDGWVAVVPTIDCGCRSVLGLTVTKDQHGPAVLASVDEALREAFGAPKYVPAGVELRTDHGPQYTGADCAAFVAAWGLVHTFAPVGRPTGNAVAERVIRTMKEEVVWLRDWNSADELREALIAWRHRYNTRRPHQALGWKTPAEYRAEKLGAALKLAA